MIISPELAQLVSIKKVTNDKGVPEMKHLYRFAKSNQEMSSNGFKETVQVIHDFMVDQNVDYGLIMKMCGIYVLTPRRIDMNPILFKLQTGINFFGELDTIPNLLIELNLQNRW